MRRSSTFRRRDGLALHVWLIVSLLAITAPVTTVLLALAALFRQRQAGEAVPPRLALSEAGKLDSKHLPPGVRSASVARAPERTWR